MLDPSADKKYAAGEALTLVQNLEQISGILSDIQNAAIKAHLLSLSAGNKPYDKKQLDIMAEQFCSLASQAATAISDMNRILEIMHEVPASTKSKGDQI